jgi:hypothetical protein
MMPAIKVAAQVPQVAIRDVDAAGTRIPSLKAG